jgi:hypothetical protein
MRMFFATVGYANGPAKSRNGKGTTYSRAATAPHSSRASAPEVSPRRTTWAIALVLIICVRPLTLGQAQSTGSTTIRTHRAPGGCVYWPAWITSANVTTPREFARIPAIVNSSVEPVIEEVTVDYFLLPVTEVESARPIWLISAPPRLADIRPPAGKVVLCGLHGLVSDSE